MTPCAIVPSHDHWKALSTVVRGLRQADLPVFIIDDGSAPPIASAIAAFHDPEHGVIVCRLPVNRGKGAAVMEGFRLAREAGFTHAVQVDADGQHDLQALGGLLALAKRHPQALVTGLPIYGGSIPTSRRIGRWFTHVWVWVETLSLQITDSMCGFRVYPLAAIHEMFAAGAVVGRRMEFDTEIMVRLFWRGVSIVGLPVRVTYPQGNTSNFDLWQDNLRISWMHTRLVFGMLRRLPSLLARGQNHPNRESRHWASLAERGTHWGLRFCVLTYRLLGRRVCLALMAPIVGWFLLTGAEQRRASRLFLGRVFGRPATLGECYRQFFSFAARALDTFIGWTGGITKDAVSTATPQTLQKAMADPRGAVIVVAHLGNVDLARALLDEKTRSRLTVLVHTRHAVNYNRILRVFRPVAAMNLVQVSTIGPETAIALKERIDRGDWVVIAGDRIPVGSKGRVCDVPFLGIPALFSQGPWILAALLRCPVHLLFCIKDGRSWRLSLEPFADSVSLPRQGRETALHGYAERYARRLEDYARQAPFQWYNFFDFWAH